MSDTCIMYIQCHIHTKFKLHLNKITTEAIWRAVQFQFKLINYI